MWIILVLIYGILKGIRDIAKKKALTKSGVTEVLFVYTLLAFLFTVPTVGIFNGASLSVPGKEMGLIAFKSFIIFIAFLCSFYAIEKMPVSLYGVIDLSRMLFAMILGVFVLKEVLKGTQIVALILVAGGLLMLKYKPKAVRTGAVREEKISTVIYILAFVSTFLNALSGMLDKILMRTGNVTSGQLQFWYMLFMVIYYGIFVVVTKTRINWKGVLGNPYVWLISVLFVIADRCLFIANGYGASRVTVMTLLKQVCCIVTIAGGRIIFKEKNTLQRFICAAVIIAGIVISVL
ncbi:MAG: DMT family transporter [Lachnospiraceae bacterium]|nr:DMT family transporter [Lachnospiraceae bacterium]